MNFALRYLKHLESKSTGDWRKSGGIPFNGFEFRKGPAAHTKGISMYPEPFVIRNNNGEEVAVLLMDCQGLT
jgi:atlastin